MGIRRADLPEQTDQTQKFKEIRERFFSMPPSEALSRSQLAQQAQPPPPHSQASEHKDQPSASASPRDHMESGLAALQQGSYSAMSNDTPSEDADARNKSKRELSTSKRAAQNRAAQRAFRQRKERYITELEEKVKQFETMETDFRSLQDENHQLREYILSLQSQLLEQTREPSSAPSSPPRRRRDAEQAPEHVSHDRIAPPSLPPSVAAQSETSKSGSWSEHIDNLRQRYSEYPAHRSSIGGSASYTPEEKRVAKD
ncbi:hypothetical protein MBLNU13_g07085t1 [Cladosporium sp. NU13]